MRPFQLSLLLAVPMTLALAQGCGSSRAAPPPVAALRSTTADPSAEGQVTYHAAANGNTSLVVDVEHLAPPNKILPGATTYVVWTRSPANGPLQNVGALDVDRNLNGRLRTITPLREFDVIVTAEPSPTATAPTGKQVLSTHVRRDNADH